MLSILLCSFCIATLANAQQAADTACDPEYYNSLKARAWLEAQREITQNQNLIFKPDSVLEYTCFDRYLDVTATQAENMFSETSRWSFGGGNRNKYMDNTLQALVGSPVASYINANFETPDYDLLGGRANGIDHTVSSINGGGYECDIMNRVWMQAKCMDFISNQDHDGFFTFADYQSSNDKRFLPTQCSAINQRWQDNYGTALLETPAQNGGKQTPWIEDILKTYFNNFDPAQCGAAVPTGVTVIRNQSPSSYDEKICLAPGCHFVPDGNGGSCRKS